MLALLFIFISLFFYCCCAVLCISNATNHADQTSSFSVLYFFPLFLFQLEFGPFICCLYVSGYYCLILHFFTCLLLSEALLNRFGILLNEIKKKTHTQKKKKQYTDYLCFNFLFVIFFFLFFWLVLFLSAGICSFYKTVEYINMSVRTF